MCGLNQAKKKKQVYRINDGSGFLSSCCHTSYMASAMGLLVSSYLRAGMSVSSSLRCAPVAMIDDIQVNVKRPRHDAFLYACRSGIAYVGMNQQRTYFVNLAIQ